MCEMKRPTERSQLLLPAQRPVTARRGALPKLVARNSVQVSHMDNKNPVT